MILAGPAICNKWSSTETGAVPWTPTIVNRRRSQLWSNLK